MKHYFPMKPAPTSERAEGGKHMKSHYTYVITIPFEWVTLGEDGKAQFEPIADKLDVTVALKAGDNRPFDQVLAERLGKLLSDEP